MENKKTAVFGIYTTVAAADLATDSLVKAGFSAADVSALLPENLGSKPIATEKNSKAPEGDCNRSEARGQFSAGRWDCLPPSRSAIRCQHSEVASN